jgi:hypothetical protein
MTDGTFPRRPPVGIRFHHLRSRNHIGSEGPDFHFFTVGLFDLPYDGGANTGALAVYDRDTNQNPIPPSF